MISHSEWKISILLVVLLQIFNQQQAGRCSHLGSNHVKTTTTTTIAPSGLSEDRLDDDDDDDDDIKGASRAVGGIRATKVPDWLATIHSTNLNPEYKDKRFLGSAIGLDQNHFLIPESAHTAGQYVPPLPGFIPGFVEFNKRKLIVDDHREWQNPAPQKFDTETFLPTKDLAKYKILGNVGTELQVGTGPGPFRLAKTYRDGLGSGFMGVTVKPITFSAPKLEHDSKEFGTDCKGYGYSDSPYGGSSRAGKTMELVTFPVSKRVCDGPSCNLQVDELDKSKPGFCGGMGEVGMPVLCGKEQKLTYIAHRAQPFGKVSGCSDQFQAYHVPHMINDIKSILPNWNPNGGSRSGQHPSETT